MPTPSGSPTPDPNTPAPAAGLGYTVIGRTMPVGGATDANQFQFSWEGVAIGVHFSGNDLSANLSEIPQTYLGHTGDSFFDVMIDGNITTSFHSSMVAQNYPLAQNVPAGEHTAWLIKRTEGMIGSSQFHGLTVGAGTHLLAPPPRPVHRIEVLGASADTGYGVEATNCAGYSADQQNQDKAWPQLTANLLGAELHNEAFSGKGLNINYDPVNDPILTVPALYSRADCNNPNAWDFSTWTADVVALDLGGNDYTGSNGNFDSQAFVTAYVAFIQQILTYYPKATIYVALNPTDAGSERDALSAADQSVVTTLVGMGHKNVKFIEFPVYTGTVFACDSHPPAALHQQMATQLAAQIKKDLGW